MPRLVVLILVLGFTVALTALADEPPPVQLGALVRGFAIPAQGRPDVQAAGTWRQRFDLDDANEYGTKAIGSEAILIDGEAAQLSYDLRYGVARDWDLGVFVPLLMQGGGILDPIIQDWHRFWGLPNGGRQRAPNDRYRYVYTRDGRTTLDVRHGSAAFADIQFTTGYQLADRVAARAMFKLPTGSASNLSGNGAAGGAVWLDGGLPLEHAFRRLTLYASVGYSFNGTGQILQQQQKTSLPFGSGGIGLEITDRCDARFQIYANAPAYKDSQLIPLARVGMPLTVTIRYRVAATSSFSIGFQEKAIYFASPDFGVHVGVAVDSR
ncbi:MAG: DUF3187 family protein [Pseudomonadota bacterium]|nr:DUF3187 family protein [Pseudomonadota bacterium]